MSSSKRTGSGTAQAAIWGQSAHMFARQEDLKSPLYDTVFNQLRLSAGMRLLDVGCGTGRACELAVRRGAEVIGLDATPEALAIARDRVPEGTFYQGDMEQLPFNDASFNVVTGFNSFQYAASPLAALNEGRRVVSPGGRVAIAVWGRPEANEAFIARQKAIRAFLPPSPAGSPGPFALASERVLEALVHEAGLTPVDHGFVVCRHTYADEDEAVRGATSGGPAVRAIQIAGEERVRSAVAGAMSPYRQEDGSYCFDLEFTFLIATA